MSGNICKYVMNKPWLIFKKKKKELLVRTYICRDP